MHITPSSEDLGWGVRCAYRKKAAKAPTPARTGRPFSMDAPPVGTEEAAAEVALPTAELARERSDETWPAAEELDDVRKIPSK